jgi:hypothetical protein
MAAACITISLAWKLPDPYWLLSYLSFLPMLSVQAIANCINAMLAPTHDESRRFTRGNIVAVAFGGLFFS